MFRRYLSIDCRFLFISIIGVVLVVSPFIIGNQSKGIERSNDSEHPIDYVTLPADNDMQEIVQDYLNTTDVNRQERADEPISDYTVVDDFESYNDIKEGQVGSKLVYKTWKDGFKNPTNGATFGYIVGDSLENRIVYGGNYSVPLFYDNTVAGLSEVTVNTDDLPIGRDWTKGSPRMLVLWLYGDPDNKLTDQLYFKINNSKVIYDGDISRRGWHQWNIDLLALGTDLSNVSTLTIGLERIGSRGGRGAILIDEIRLYRVAPVPGQRAGLFWSIVGVMFILLSFVLVILRMKKRKTAPIQ
jgi:hypothetical protein